jgi:DNA-binding transcriptional LysR family regulator
MRREELGDLTAFAAIADERSFTRAAAKLAISQSALSHTVRRLEERLGVRLLARTTRNVALTEAGERLIETLRPALDEIDARLAALSQLRERPGGAVRITTSEHAARTILWPKVKDLLAAYPDLKVELSIEGGLTDIVTERFDAGVRLGEHVAKDMIAVRIGPQYSMAVVAAPSYFDKHGKPKTPQDLVKHACINIRFEASGGLYAWELEKNDRELNVRVDGQLIVNHMPMIIDAAVSGLGIAFTIDDQVKSELAEGSLVRVMKDWCPPFAGYHLYYPSRRQQSRAMALMIEALRYRD